MLADVLSQINGRKHATTQVAPNLAYSDPEMAEIALRNIGRRAKHKVTRPKIKVGDMVRIRVKPIESTPTGSTERKGIQGSLRRERGDGGEVWLGGVAGKGGAQGSPKSPQKLSSRTEGAVPPEEATERPQAPTSLLTLSVLLRLHNVSDSSACHSLTSFFTSGWGLGRAP